LRGLLRDASLNCF